MRGLNRDRGRPHGLSLREFINEVERLGEYKVIEGADWDLELGLITEWKASLPNPPLLLFDKIKGYPLG